MTFDLFADEPAVAPAPPAAAVTAPVTPRHADHGERVKGEDFTMQPMLGEVNRWLYKGEVVCYFKSQGLNRPPEWATVEGLGRPEIRSTSRIEVCRAIDARRAA